MSQPRKIIKSGMSETEVRDGHFVSSLEKNDIQETRRLLDLGVSTKTINAYLCQAASDPEFLPFLRLFLEYADPTANHSHPLSVASHNGHLGIVQILAPLSDLNDPDCKAFRFAAQNGHLDVVQFLEPLVTPFHKKDALLVAAELGQIDIFRHLFQGADIATKHKCFEESMWHGQHTIVKFLLGAGYMPDSNNNKELHRIWLGAVQEGFLEVLRLTAHLVDPSENNSEALACASMERHQDVFDFLYPLSNPRDALHHLYSMSFFQPEYTKLLLTRINVEESKKDLHERLFVSDAHEKTKPRKI